MDRGCVQLAQEWIKDTRKKILKYIVLEPNKLLTDLWKRSKNSVHVFDMTTLGIHTCMLGAISCTLGRCTFKKLSEYSKARSVCTLVKPLTKLLHL